MNNLILRKVVVTANYQPLVATPLIGSVTVSTPPTNAGNVLFKGDDGAGAGDVPWVPGEWHEFVKVDLSRLQVKGTPGDVVTLVGGTW